MIILIIQMYKKNIYLKEETAAYVKDAFNKYLITAYENTRKYRKGIHYT